LEVDNDRLLRRQVFDDTRPTHELPSDRASAQPGPDTEIDGGAQKQVVAAGASHVAGKAGRRRQPRTWCICVVVPEPQAKGRPCLSGRNPWNLLPRDAEVPWNRVSQNLAAVRANVRTRSPRETGPVAEARPPSVTRIMASSLQCNRRTIHDGADAVAGGGFLLRSATAGRRAQQTGDRPDPESYRRKRIP
jgi:hypothetical protein